GRRALALLHEHGIEVRTGASGTVREAIEAWKNGQLTEGDPCTRHMFHGQGG
ncbi:NifB/NifX family molybdenum-iron cluster-binding protein, partial [Candidatus Bipolaricaulota bacterium]|nr:NifB/NifX family molybdenum-iron cluster-binding protein [Candidatus Bipolaricaulota bacterium]